MFKVKLVKFEKAIVMQVLEMNESLRDNLNFKASNGIGISSSAYLTMDCTKVFLRGKMKDEDDSITSKSFDTNTGRDIYFNEIVLALKECKESLKSKEKEETCNCDIVII